MVNFVKMHCSRTPPPRMNFIKKTDVLVQGAVEPYQPHAVMGQKVHQQS